MPDARQTKFGALDYQQNAVKNRLDHSVDPDEDCYVVFYDLDGFKAINDNVGYDVGDDVLRDVAASMEELAHDCNMIGVCKGGDEFGLIIKGDILVVLEIVLALKDKISARNYGQQELKVGFTAGIVKLPDLSGYVELDQAFSTASKCMTEAVEEGIEGKGKKKKGTVSYATMQNPPLPTLLSNSDFVKLGIAIGWIKQGIIAPFSNIFLNIISSRVAALPSTEIDKLAQTISDLLIWLGLKLRSENSINDLTGPQVESTLLSNFAIGIAVVHGLHRYAKRNESYLGEISLVLGDSSCAVHCDDSVIWGDAGAQVEKLFVAPTQMHADGIQKFSRGFGLKIGFATSENDLTTGSNIKDLFADFVVVDDRPKTGGGLPDFWQAAVAQVYSIIAQNSNLESLYIFGNPANAPETLKRLSVNSVLNTDEIAAVTMLPHVIIQQCGERLSKLGALKYVINESQLIDFLYSDTFITKKWTTKQPAESKNPSSRIVRRLDVSEHSLRSTDGLRCATAAQAYPLIVELLRTSESVSKTYDDASQSLSEVIGFKLVIEQPNSDSIPEYWHEQREAFAEYANEVLIDTSSTIGKNFYQTGQFDAFIKQLLSYCSNGNEAKSTRRAILVVPNEVVNHVTKPLGLVSLWATPRISNKVMTLEFCYVWRTVEALVGLPYSLYGSIAFSDHVVNSLRSRVQQAGYDIELQTGAITYLALSLHMRDDHFHGRIAKRIVDAASI
jgi:diguanylate cyclase (GGDEF)-like protein